MFFEGSEKKVEVIIKDIGFSLINDVNDEFWYQLVDKANAKILSCIQNDVCKAFILSESSLFVWHNRFIILTCGVTHLVNAIEYFIQEQGVDVIEHLSYQRKNEYYSHAQPSCFGDDVKVLTQYIKGKALRFGEMDSHHTFLFYNDTDTQLKHKSYELLTYQISEEASNKLTDTQISADEIRIFLQLDTLLPGFILDDHMFKPYGYSVNAIKEDKYLTIHITPQAESSYVSFESNINLIEISPILLERLKPKSFDLLSFNDENFEDSIEQYIDQKYVSKSLVKQNLTNGCQVHFANYVLPQKEFIAAAAFDLLDSHHEL
ncbi:adenosylmethionine decarboxylase [Pseudocolwellia sp. HL-MZ7]|uniref:adenosylmethionine decarboxylase n=1 Tax=Pseudocolwellia sp. HL-MZ7 TaxID=3400627 RepID=UPI003CEB9837